MSPDSSWRPSLVTMAVTSISVTASYCLYQCVSQYGWEGTYWYLWEGDPYPPAVRKEFLALDQVQAALRTEGRSLDRLEEAYERAKLDSIDGSSNTTLVGLWDTSVIRSYKKAKNAMTLEKLLAKVSYNLDKYAAQVDAVPSKKHSNLKPRKKDLSNQIVQLMQRADVYLELYKGGRVDK